jgi:hypothetical protein
MPRLRRFAKSGARAYIPRQSLEIAPLWAFGVCACCQKACPGNKENRMAKKPGTNPKGEFVFFDVVYEDGTQRSNRRVPSELLGGLEKDEPARGFIMEQDREIAEKSGRAPLKIKSLKRSGGKKK